MALSFPGGPTPGQVYAAPNGVNYTWDNGAGVWTAAGAASDGSVRAWVNFDGTTVTPTIRAAGNVSSVTKVGTGQYTVNFTTAMVDANYALTGTQYSITQNMNLAATSFTSGSVSFYCSGGSGGGSGVSFGNFDGLNVCVAIIR